MAKAEKKPTLKDLNLIENPQADSCEYCGMEYADFDTGEDYQSVYDSLWKASDDPTEWLNKGRHTVLGRWHEIKQEMWRNHLDECAAEAESGGVEDADWDFDDEY